MKRTAKTSRISRALIAGVLALILTLFPGCFDLGMFEDGEEEGYADYYAAFGDVKTVSEKGTHYYDFKDSLFNKETLNDYSWKNSSDAVASEPYTFIVIPVERDMTVEIVSFCLKADKAANLDVLAYTMKAGDVPSSVFFYDDAGDEDEEKDPNESVLPVANAACSVNWRTDKDKFKAVSVSFKKDGTGLSVKDGDVILIYITNNTRYGYSQGKERCSFTFLNMLIRAVE